GARRCTGAAAARRHPRRETHTPSALTQRHPARLRPVMAHVAYVSYDGIHDQLGQSQVLPYVTGLAAQHGHTFDLVSFEKPGAPTGWRETIAPGVRWTGLRYHQTPTVPATSFDLVQGNFAIAALQIFSRADFVHVRSYVPCLMALPWAVAARKSLLFD